MDYVWEWKLIEKRHAWRDAREGAYLLRTNLKEERTELWRRSSPNAREHGKSHDVSKRRIGCRLGPRIVATFSGHVARLFLACRPLLLGPPAFALLQLLEKLVRRNVQWIVLKNARDDHHRVRAENVHYNSPAVPVEIVDTDSGVRIFRQNIV